MPGRAFQHQHRKMEGDERARAEERKNGGGEAEAYGGGGEEGVFISLPLQFNCSDSSTTSLYLGFLV